MKPSKIGKKDSSVSPLLLARTVKKISNKSISTPEQTKSFKVSRARQILIHPVYLTAEHSTLQSNLLHSLKESLTVKRIEFSQPKISVNLNSLPLRSRQIRARALDKVESLGNLKRKRFKARSVGERCQSKKQEQSQSPRCSPKRIVSVKKEYLTPRVPSYTPPVPRVQKQLPRMAFKEAMRNLNWSLRAKPELDKMWRKMIGRSYGLDLVQAQGGRSGFKFFVGKGNNSRLVARCLASRSWWSQVESIAEAQFAWTQWKDKEFLQRFKVMELKPGALTAPKAPTAPCQLLSPVPFTTEINQFRPVEIDDLGFQIIRNSASYVQMETKELDPCDLTLYNKLEFNQHLSNKKGLFKSLKKYYQVLGKNVFDYIPITFHVKNTENDLDFEEFVESFMEIESSKKNLNLWIIKPGENSNRGQGICVAGNLDQIKALVSPQIDPLSGKLRTYIIQKYIEKPLLIHKRKFDIRCYALVTSINGIIQAYSYADGYLRTTSTEYSTKDISNNLIHLTNDAIQKYSEEYGKFEDGNKLSYKDFQRYLDFHCSDKKVNFFNDILPNIKNLIKDSIQSVFLKIDPKKRLHCMEIFGYDFMIDSNFKPWLIEVNTNPCLELSSNYLSTLIPAMLENAFKVVIDPLFPPPVGKHMFESFTENKFELIFHSEVDGELLVGSLKDQVSVLLENEEISDKEEIFSDAD